MHACFLLSNSSTASSSSASISPTRSCSSSSTTTCLSSNKRSTRRRALSGPSLILAWTCSLVSIWSRRYNKTTNDGSILASENPTDGCSAGSKKKIQSWITNEMENWFIKQAEIPGYLSQIRGDRHTNAYSLKIQLSDRPLFFFCMIVSHFYSFWSSSATSHPLILLFLFFFCVVDLAISSARIVSMSAHFA